jgi:hypothetical protein
MAGLRAGGEWRAAMSTRSVSLTFRISWPLLAGAAAALALAAMLGAPGAAQAGRAFCGDREQILDRLQQKHHETPQALGLSADGGLLELLVSPEGGWTILVTYPARPSCIVAVGQKWQTLALAGEPA